MGQIQCVVVRLHVDVIDHCYKRHVCELQVVLIVVR